MTLALARVTKILSLFECRKWFCFLRFNINFVSQEMKQRASMLKRLSFAVFSSETDQYQSFLPEFQDRLAECLRLPQVPVLHEQVFLFFRVLLVRMSDNMTSIWPMIISEMIHVFLLMESDLLQAGTPSRDQQMFYSETVLGASGYINYSEEKWLGLYLSVCKPVAKPA